MRTLIAAVVAAKLVISTANGVTVTDYPSMERCEVAKAALEKQWRVATPENVPQGYHLVKPPALTAVCIPA